MIDFTEEEKKIAEECIQKGFSRNELLEFTTPRIFMTGAFGLLKALNYSFEDGVWTKKGEKTTEALDKEVNELIKRVDQLEEEQEEQAKVIQRIIKAQEVQEQEQELKKNKSEKDELKENKEKKDEINEKKIEIFETFLSAEFSVRQIEAFVRRPPSGNDLTRLKEKLSKEKQSKFENEEIRTSKDKSRPVPIKNTDITESSNNMSYISSILKKVTLLENELNQLKNKNENEQNENKSLKDIKEDFNELKENFNVFKKDIFLEISQISERNNELIEKKENKDEIKENYLKCLHSIDEENIVTRGFKMNATVFRILEKYRSDSGLKQQDIISSALFFYIYEQTKSSETKYVEEKLLHI